jgi:hypothetical protein
MVGDVAYPAYEIAPGRKEALAACSVRGGLTGRHPMCKSKVVRALPLRTSAYKIKSSKKKNTQEMGKSNGTRMAWVTHSLCGNSNIISLGQRCTCNMHTYVRNGRVFARSRSC